jgi:mRNA interferase MazF
MMPQSQRRRTDPLTHDPKRGEAWWADMEPVVGHEQGGFRPVLVNSVDPFNSSKADLLIALTLTTQNVDLPIRSHVVLQPPDGGTTRASAIKPEDVRSISTDRLTETWGSISSATMELIEDRLRILLAL